MDFIDALMRLQTACNGCEAAKNLADQMHSDTEFELARQTAVAVFCTQAGDPDDKNILRDYLNEAYSGENLEVKFKS